MAATTTRTDPGSGVESPELVARIRAGDPEALQAAVHAYLSQVLRAARGAGLDPQRAEDVTQATFATFLETASRFEGRSRVRTWLFGILYNKIAEARREIAKDRKKDPIDEVVEQRFRSDKDAGKLKHYQVSLGKRNNVWVARECARLAREILGANGIVDDYPVIRHMLNIESVYTYEGTHDILGLVIGEQITGIPSFNPPEQAERLEPALGKRS